MITLFKGCLVILLHRHKNRQWELCLFPPFKTIERHRHGLEDIELLHLWGADTYYYRYSNSVDRVSVITELRDTFRFFTIPANYWHGAIVGPWGLITVSCQKWKTSKPESVTKDFIYA